MGSAENDNVPDAGPGAPEPGVESAPKEKDVDSGSAKAEVNKKRLKRKPKEKDTSKEKDKDKESDGGGNPEEQPDVSPAKDTDPDKLKAPEKEKEKEDNETLTPGTVILGPDGKIEVQDDNNDVVNGPDKNGQGENEDAPPPPPSPKPKKRKKTPPPPKRKRTPPPPPPPPEPEQEAEPEQGAGGGGVGGKERESDQEDDNQPGVTKSDHPVTRTSGQAQPQEQEDDDDSSSEGFLKGLQNDDSFHGMLPDEDIDKLLTKHGDYILHTVEKDGRGRVIGISVFWHKSRVFTQVRAGATGVTFDMRHYRKTILELTRFHVECTVPVGKDKFGMPITPRRAVLREDWELRHDDVELLDKLGEGAFGEVRLGKLKQRNKGTINVAVKVIKGTVTKQAIEEAMREARIMRKYCHPNVVRFYGVQAEIEPLMLVMEFVKGGSLDGYLKKNSATITVGHRASMCYDAACGLEYLHLQDCIHRDIAARNCLMDVVSRRLKLSDFGLSSIGTVQVLDPNKPAPIRWLAPEVIRTSCFGKPADVWSFGVLCWEIYVDAEIPYKEFTMAEVQTRIFDENFRLRLPLTCQTELRKLIASCWTGNVATRPTMSDCVRALRPFFDEKNTYVSDEAIKRARMNRPRRHKPSRALKPNRPKPSKKTLTTGVSKSAAMPLPPKPPGPRKQPSKPKPIPGNSGAQPKKRNKVTKNEKKTAPRSDKSDTDVQRSDKGNSKGIKVKTRTKISRDASGEEAPKGKKGIKTKEARRKPSKQKPEEPESSGNDETEKKKQSKGNKKTGKGRITGSVPKKGKKGDTKGKRR